MAEYKATKELASLSKKVISYFLDALILLILTVAINFGSVAILETTPNYKENSEVVSTSVSEIYSLEEEARFIDLYNLDNEKVSSPISQNDMFQKWLVRHLLHSYEVNDKTIFTSIDKISENELKYGEASLENDYLAYFYVEFLPNHQNEGMIEVNISGEDYFKNNILDVKLSNDDIFYFDNNNFYTLTPSYAKDIYNYMYLNEDNDNAYNALKALNEFFLNTLENTATIYQHYIPFKEKYEIYSTSYSILLSQSVLTEFITYLICTLIYFLIVPLFLKLRSIGELILKLTPYDLDEKKIEPYKQVFKFLISFCELFWINLIVSFFTIGMDGMSLNLFNIGNIPINLLAFVILSMVISAISVLVALVRQDHRAFKEVATHTVYITLKKEKSWDHIPVENEASFNDLEKSEEKK